MKQSITKIAVTMILLLAGYFAGYHSVMVVYAQGATSIPKAFGHCVGAVERNAGTSLVFEDGAGVVRIVNLNGKLEATMNRN
jgi:hypothetical protein